ncbi:MAG: CocE/NonD family hydrolase [Bacteroidetes bacterium]|nr:CocE/NonD family hydrolase [Bacteroidota bacterium]
MMKNLLYAFFLFFFLGFAKESLAVLTPQVDSIPMGDGRKLAADIYIPKGMAQGPVILVQTPYNRQRYRVIGLPLVGMNLDSSSYIFVILDWRGFYGSAAAKYAGAPDNGKDGYDAVEWIAAQTWSNGKVGTWGLSALGRVQFATAKKNPPHLTCICPLVAAPQYQYDEYFPNGCLKTEYVQQLDVLGFGTSAIIMTHPVHDLTWTFAESANFYPDSIRVPCFMIGGWYDHNIETMLDFYTAIQNSNQILVRDQHRLLMGPWVHGGSGMAQVGSVPQGELNYPASAHWNDSLALRFFDFYLRNEANGWDQSPKVQYFQMGEDVWQNSPSWPPAGGVNTNFYLHKDGLLDVSVPTSNADSLTFNYDPTDPSPTIGGPTLRADLVQGPYDQAILVESRNDILTFTTNTLTQNMAMRGNVVVHLKVSSNRRDTDFDIRLTDVYPDSRSMLVNDGVMRMRFRNGINAADTMLMIPGTDYDCVMKLPCTSLTFLAGHRIRVDVTSSNYPRFNRNMNTGGVMYPGNSMDSLVNPVVASNTVYTNVNNTSYITLPLVGFNGIDGRTMNQAEVIKVFPNRVSNLLNIELSSDAIYGITLDFFPKWVYSKNKYTRLCVLLIELWKNRSLIISLLHAMGNYSKTAKGTV